LFSYIKKKINDKEISMEIRKKHCEQLRIKRRAGEILAHMKTYGSVVVTLQKFKVVDVSVVSPKNVTYSTLFDPEVFPFYVLARRLNNEYTT
jgi:hypothetical protein